MTSSQHHDTGQDRGLPAAAAQLCSRLAQVPDIRLPATLYREQLPPSHEVILAHLTSLINRDPAVFLERHGKQLQHVELSYFRRLPGSYEISHWLAQLEGSTAEDSIGVPGRPLRLSTTAKNRRLAYMRQLQREGDYFSDDSMRLRAPLLFEELVGRYDSTAGLPPPSSARLSDTLLRGYDDARAQADLQAELDAEEAQFSEQETSEEEDQSEQGDGHGGGGEPMVCSSIGTGADGMAGPGVGAGDAAAGPTAGDPGGTGGGRQVAAISQADLERNREELLHEMQARFLTGQDRVHVDYGAIDADETLDDLPQMSRDAEDKYFDED